MTLLSNHRKHHRLILHQSARCLVLRGNFLESSPRLDLKAVISNLSFGGMRLLFTGRAFDDKALTLLKSGQHNLFVEFLLPPALATLNVTCKVKWVSRKSYLNTELWLLGLEFVTKTQDLYREIDRFFKLANPGSEWVRERRFFPRVPERETVRFTVSGMKRWLFFPRHFEGTIQNLSAMGLSVRTVLKEKDMETLKSGVSHLKLEFGLPTFQRMETEARAVHVEPTRFESSPGAILGIKFLGLSEKDQGGLSEYVVAKRAAFLKETAG